ncbi:hypothetical protein AtubIFM56815_008590 [Aspergillus tubingensis]|uniref:Uncharacterized protein n=1 Tax=Aspergillus tubingensis TaxID=5068 RepID=A0A8H3SLB3_ASPTU|nr:uncharacterized protein AtWU_00819 [Aspergillus tubingensis]GFN11023.1 hypothetical protein AtWU_00819 [Aspergillus tubingensis]GLA58269.1 hypothetical protein AtubIFM54640_007415 [Aspergillus tubingensis]GLA84377.1 hypothetical protein AtubIFM56815_008590 [Aspergillus tubingensis]GLB08273.1 hypothetical protein AtubIFM57258_004161 [Aspergillus tubingensis]
MACTTKTARELVQEPLPGLNIGPEKTTNHALHDVVFSGTLRPWPNFYQDVEATFINHNWVGGAICAVENGPSPHSLSHEHVRIGDEHGTQGRVNQSVGQAMGGIFRSQNMDISLGDYKSCTDTPTNYKKVPDSMLRNGAGAPYAVGEIKTPWIPRHDIKQAYLDEREFRRILG